MSAKITTIEEMNLSVREYAFLRRRGIDSLEQLLSATEEEFLSGGCYRKLGDLKSAEAILQRVKELGLAFANDVIEESKCTDPKILNMYITDLELSFSVCKIFFAEGIETVKDIIAHSEKELFDMLQNEQLCNEVKSKLNLLGVALSENAGALLSGNRLPEELTVDDLALMISPHPGVKNDLKRQFGNSTIGDIINIETFEYRGTRLRVIKMAFLRIVGLGLKFDKLDIKTPEDVENFFQNLKICPKCRRYHYNKGSAVFCSKCQKQATICLGKRLEEFDFLPSTIKGLNANNIFTTDELIKFSRVDLIQMSQIGQATIDDIVSVLEGHCILIKNDTYHICKICNHKFINSVNLDDEICSECINRIKRLNRNKKLSIRLNLKLSSFTDGQNGFIIYVDMKNESRTIQSMTFCESYIISKGRQHSYNSFLTGYMWSEKESILPNSIKTIGLIWYDSYLDYTSLNKDDELVLAFYSEYDKKMVYYKFTYTGKYINADEFLLHDIITV